MKEEISITELRKYIRNAFADYVQSEGCSCCEDTDAHNEAAKRLARLLKVPRYADGSGFDFGRFKTKQLGEIQTSFICNVEVVKNNPNYDKNGNLKIFSQDSEGEKSAEEVLIEIVGEKTIDSECQATIFWDDALKAMHEFAAQSRPELSDEAIEKKFPTSLAKGLSENIYRQQGAKWTRITLTGK